MAALIILIGISILLAAAFLGVFIWSVRNGQFSDNYSPSVRVLYDSLEKPLTK